MAKSDPRFTLNIKQRMGHLDRLLIAKKIAPDALTDDQYVMALTQIIKRKKQTQLHIPKVTPSNSEWESKAIAYAKWIAGVRHIQLPESKTRVHWCGVNTWTKTGKPKFERRIRSVSWGHEVEIYNTRKNGLAGAYLYTDWVRDVEIVLPNWDWQPDVIEITLKTPAVYHV